MQFPFGFGLSYTTFEWEVMSIAVGEEEASLGSAIDLTDADKNTTITLKVVVTNTGSVYGKDVVQLYYTPNTSPARSRRRKSTCSTSTRPSPSSLARARS